MRTAEDAEIVARSEIELHESDADANSIIRSATLAFSEGWVYYYQSSRYLENQEASAGLVGNAPLFVPRSGAKATFISYHRPVSESIAAFVSCGDANASPNSQICLVGWNVGAQVFPAIQALREHSELGLDAAKAAIEQCLGHARVVISTRSVVSARDLVTALSQVGIIAKVTYGA